LKTEKQNKKEEEFHQKKKKRKEYSYYKLKQIKLNILLN
jgi:hypothetical protein